MMKYTSGNFTKKSEQMGGLLFTDYLHVRTQIQNKITQRTYDGGGFVHDSTCTNEAPVLIKPGLMLGRQRQANSPDGGH